MTGASAESLFLTTHKLLAKQQIFAAGLPTPCWIVDDPITGCPPRPKRAIRRLFPSTPTLGRVREATARWIIKGIWEQGSRDMDDDAVFAGGLPEVRARLRERIDRGPAAPRLPKHTSKAGNSTLPCSPVRAEWKCCRRRRSIFPRSRPKNPVSSGTARNGRPIPSSITTPRTVSISPPPTGPCSIPRRPGPAMLEPVHASRLGPCRFPRRSRGPALDSGSQCQSLPVARRRVCRRPRRGHRMPCGHETHRR